MTLSIAAPRHTDTADAMGPCTGHMHRPDCSGQYGHPRGHHVPDPTDALTAELIDRHIDPVEHAARTEADAAIADLSPGDPTRQSTWREVYTAMLDTRPDSRTEEAPDAPLTLAARVASGDFEAATDADRWRAIRWANMATRYGLSAADAAAEWADHYRWSMTVAIIR